MTATSINTNLSWPTQPPWGRTVGNAISCAVTLALLVPSAIAGVFFATLVWNTWFWFRALGDYNHIYPSQGDYGYYYNADLGDTLLASGPMGVDALYLYPALAFGASVAMVIMARVPLAASRHNRSLDLLGKGLMVVIGCAWAAVFVHMQTLLMVNNLLE